VKGVCSWLLPPLICLLLLLLLHLQQLLQVDTLMMKHFLSAFSDSDAVTIINHCKAVLSPSGAILLLQTLVPEPGDRTHNTTQDGVAPGEHPPPPPHTQR
jgi:hypothetical protein